MNRDTPKFHFLTRLAACNVGPQNPGSAPELCNKISAYTYTLCYAVQGLTGAQAGGLAGGLIIGLLLVIFITVVITAILTRM